jgi:hypothetical protein
MRYSHVPSADTSAILANLSRQMLSILVSLTLVFPAIVIGVCAVAAVIAISSN